MVYKRYIKRNGKLFGPYYYESYRDKEGRTRTKIVNIPKKNFSLIKLAYILIIFSLFLTAGFIVLTSKKTFNSNLESLLVDNPAQISLGNSKILKNFIKLIGFQVSQGDDTAVPSEDDSSSQGDEAESSEQNVEVSDSVPNENAENTEIIETPVEEPVGETFTEAENESQNESVLDKESVKAKTGNFSINSSGSRITAQNETLNVTQEINLNTTQNNISLIINETITNISLTINQTNENVSINTQILQGTNFTINESTIQYGARLGQPVKWKRILKIDAEENETLNNLEITLPKTAGDVSVKKIFANDSVQELDVNVKNEKIITKTEPIISITGQFVKNGDKSNFFKKIFKFFRNFISLVGKVIDVVENEEEVLVNIQEELEDQEEIEIEYFTEAPYSEEIIFSDNHKKVNIVGSNEIHYENVLAFSNLSKEVLSKGEIALYWIKNDSKILIDLTAYDSNKNEKLDYIEWIVPSLSNQTYEIILVTKAQHLDSNRNFISDIYEQVKELDGNWSEQINDSEYVRVTFEKNLTNQNDITIYPRTISPRDDSGEPNGTVRIEVYALKGTSENNKTELIAEFTNIIDNEYNKVYLTNLNGTQDVFDLKIIGGSVEFDHIIDPFSGAGAGTLANPYEITSCVQLQEINKSLSAHYELVNNIDCSDTINWNSGAGFTPLGTELNAVFSVFNGSLQGNDYNITDLYIKNSTTYIGLFGYAVNATINKVHLWNVFVSDGGSSISIAVGGLAGAFDDNGTISNSSVHGNVTSKGASLGALQYTGGLSGWLWANKYTPKIYNSSFTGNVSGIGTAGVGGLTGWTDGVINYSFANVKLNSTNTARVGGLVGHVAVDGSESGIVDNSYALGNVSVAGGSSAARIGGLVGQNDGNILHSFSAINVSGNTGVGGLVGRNVAGNISNSYSCGGNINGGSNDVGGLIGFAQPASNASFSYSANFLSLTEGTNVGGLVGNNGTGGPANFDFNFYDYEIDGGNYNDIGNTGNLSNTKISDNTTAQMKKETTYTPLGWNFTNIWRITGESYPHLRWQSAPVCGLPPPSAPTTDLSSSGISPAILELSTGFNVNPKKINITLNQSESKTECFAVTSTGTLSITTSLSVLGDITPFTSLTNSVLTVPVQNSKTACAIFSADKFDIPKKYTGQIQVATKEKKYIDVFLEIREVKKATNISVGILPVSPLLPSGPTGILPIFSITVPTGILPIFSIYIPSAGPIGILPVGSPEKLIDEKIIETLVKGVGVVFLWIILLLILIAYLAIKRFVKLQNQLEGYKSREEKFEALERLKRTSLRKDINFFEKMVDKGAIYLTEKALKSKEIISKELSAEILPADVRMAYNHGAELYSLGEYDNALKEFQKSVEIDKKFWQGYQGIGSCYLAKGQIEEAKSAFEKSLLINPDNKELAEWLKKYKKDK